MLLETILWILFFCLILCFCYLLLNLCYDVCNKEKELLVPIYLPEA